MPSSAGFRGQTICRKHEPPKCRKLVTSRQGIPIREDLSLQPNRCKNLEFSDMPVNVTHDIWFFRSSRGINCYCGLLVYDTVWFGKWLTLCYGATCYHVGEVPAKATLPVEQCNLVNMTHGLLLRVEHLQANVSFWPAKNLTELADGPPLYVDWQGQGVCFASSATPLSLTQYNFLLEKFPLPKEFKHI